MGSAKRITLSDFYQHLQEQGKNADIVKFLADESNRLIVVPDPGDASYLQRMRHPEPKVLLPRKFTQPVMIKNVHFAVHVDWSDRRFEDGLSLIGCRFWYGLCLRDLHVIGRCVITGCEVRDTARHWIDWRRLRCEGEMDLSGTTAHHPIDLYNSRIGDDLRIDGLWINRTGKSKEEVEENDHLTPADRHHVSNEMVGKALTLEGAEIRRHVYGYPLGERRMQIKGRIDLRAKVTGQVVFRNAIVDAEGKLAVVMEGAEIGGSVFFTDKTQIKGMINLRAKVKGGVEFVNAIVDAPDETAVNFATAEIGGSVFFTDKTQITGQTAVNFNAAEIGGNVFFKDKTQIKGRIDLRAKVTGQVEFINAIVDAPGKTAVDFEAAEIGGIVLFRDKTLIHGQISAIQSRLRCGIWATPDMNRTAFTYPGTPLAWGESRHLLITGGIDLRYAELDGPLLLHGATIAESFNARHLVVNGDLHLCGSVMGRFSPESKRLMDEAIKHLTDALQELTDIEHKIRQTEHPDEEMNNQRAAADEKVVNCREALWGWKWKNWELQDIPVVNVPDDPKKLFAERQKDPYINLELSVIRGQFWVKSSRILGTIHAEDAEIDGEANFSKSKVEGNLVLRSIKVQGKVFADETDATGPYPQVRGKVDLQHAKLLQINVNFTHSNDPDAILPQELDLSGAQTAELCLLGELAPRKSAGAANPAGSVLRMDGIKFESICVTPRSNEPKTVSPLKIDLTGIETDPSINRRRVLLAWVGSVAFLCICFGVWYLGITGDWAHAIIENYPRNHLGFDQPRAYYALGVWTLMAFAIAITMRKNLARIPWVTSSSGSPMSEPAESPASKCTWRDVMRTSTWIGLVGLAGLLLVLLSPDAMTYGRWEIVIAAVVLIIYVTLTVYRWMHPKILSAETTTIVRLLRRVEPSRQLYIDVEQMFKRQGDDESADEVFLTRRKAEPFPFTQEARKRKKWHFWSTVQDIAAGYGSRVSRPIHLYLLLFMINSLVFANPLAVEYQRGAGHNRRDVGPQATQLPTTMAVNPWESDGGKPNEGQWGILRGMFISLRIQIPFLPLIADADWAPTSRPMRTLPLSYENYAAVCVAINLALLPLMFSGLRRAMKKDAI